MEDVCFPRLPAQSPLKALGVDDDEGGGGGSFALLVSGLKMGGGADPLPLHLLTEFVLGKIGSLNTQHLSSRVSCVIVAGNSLRKPDEPTGTRVERAKKVADKSKSGGGVFPYDPFLLQPFSPYT